MSNWNDLEKELLADPKVKKEYEKLAPRYGVISELITARINKGMTQREVADKIGTKQSAIARLESGSTNPSLEFVQKVAQVMGYKLNIHLSK